jgi:PIN domain nuclease of toxin-antitoxin system
VRLLLDTHTTIWWLDAPKRLGKIGYSMIADPANEVLISAIIS